MGIPEYRIESDEIESALRLHPGVAECAVAVREIQSGSRQLVAWIVPSGVRPLRSELQAFLKRILPDDMIPAVFVVLHTLPLTPDGKIDREALPLPDLSPADAARALTVPRVQ